jgi:hypothetical protein
MSGRFLCLLRGAVLVWAVVLAAQAQAQARLDAPSSTCAQLQASLQRLGGALVSTGPYLYDTYFANESGCGIRRRPVPSYVATRDNRQCFLGYRCAESQRK